MIISFLSSLSNYYDAGGRVLPLRHYSVHQCVIPTRTDVQTLSKLSFFLTTNISFTTFRDRQLFFDSQLKACFDEVDRARLQLALQQFAKENNSSPGDI